MQREESRTDLGTIRIHKNAIASIASVASLEIEGVKRVGGNLKGAMMELMGQKNMGGIRVEINKNEEVRVEIPLIIKYGYNIPDIAAKVQENVRSALEKMTNLFIKDVDVNVRRIEKD